MTPPSFTQALDAGVLLCDGAMGTLAQASGVRAEGPGAELCLIAPELVRSLHRRYLDAGADVIETHTYGATRPRLARAGLAGRTREINRAAAALAVAARDERAGEDRPVWVAGSVSPATPAAGPSRVPAGAPGARQRDDAVREQAAALVEGGVDLLVLETFTAGDELARAVAAVREVTDLPVVAQATFLADEPRPLTAAGEEPAAVLARLAEAGALDLAAVGSNCTLGPQGLLAVLRELREHTGLPLAAQPNAGLPHVVDDRSVRFAADADHFARYVRRYVAAGARLVGGCCGTTPEHTAAARAVLDALSDDTEPEPAAVAPVARERAVVTRRPGDGPARGPRGALRQRLGSGPSRRAFLVGADVARSGAVDDNVERARAVARAVDLVRVGYSRTRRAAVPPAALAVATAERVDVDVAVTMTGWGAGRLAVQADLLGLHAVGVRTVICETAAPPVHADHPVRGVGDEGWDVDAVALLRLADGLNRGVDADGLELPGATALLLGARLRPGAPDPAAEVARVVAEIGAGARFLVSDPVFELERTRDLLDAVRARVDRDVPVLLTLVPPRDFAHAEYLAHEVGEVVVPPPVLARVRRDGDGVAHAAEIARDATAVADGIVVRWSGHDPAAVLAALRTATRR